MTSKLQEEVAKAIRMEHDKYSNICLKCFENSETGEIRDEADRFAQAALDVIRKNATIKTDNTQMIINMQRQIDELAGALEIIANGSSILDSEIAYKAITKLKLQARDK